MIKIIHMADTHLGYREGRGAINKWAIENYSRPFEQEIYDIFIKVMEEVSKIKEIDFLVHCGDIFHLPFVNNSYPPQEPARRALKQGLDIFFKNTNFKVPFIYIEGNHGVYRGYDYTPFESHINKSDYPDLYYFKERDLINAIKSNKPLNLEFEVKKVRFYLFPYFEFKNIESYKVAYDNWIKNQNPPNNDDYINIAIAHGSKADGSLHKKVRNNDYNYHYIALGHEHSMKAESKNQYYAGCLLPMNFKERYENQGYLIVNIDENSKNLKIEKIFTDKYLNRPFEIKEINVTPNKSTIDLREQIYSI
ncbi:MAG: metallophosphoesterase family protein, partial [Promethearchaeota archaeon]